MTIKISYKEFNLIVHNTDEGFGGLIEDNKVFKVENGKSKFWDASAYTLPELEVKFKKLVDEKLEEIEKKKKESWMTDAIKIDSSEWYYEGFILYIREISDYKIAECKEIGFYYRTLGDIDHVVHEFKKAVYVKLRDDKKKDEDLFIVETFIEKLTLINKEMQLLRDNPHKHLVLDVKLGKLYEKAKDVFHLNSYDSFKTYYFMKFPDSEDSPRIK